MTAGASRRAGLTLVELMIASGLAALVMVALFRLLDVTLDMWAKGETRRGVIEQASATAELLAGDLRALHPGEQGDLLVDWWSFDVDSDGTTDRMWPRIRLVRQASRADLARLAAEAIDPELLAAAEEQNIDLEDLLPEGTSLPRPASSGLMTVAWAVVPAGKDKDSRAEGVLLRGEQLLQAGVPSLFFEQDFFSGAGQPRAGYLREVTGGVLWVGLRFATQTSIVWDEWKIGPDIADSSASWDAWNRGRPDPEVHGWNEPGAGMPVAVGQALLPRRVRIELEFEGERERRRRTRLLDALDKTQASFMVSNGSGLPTAKGRFVLVEGEWMELRSVRGDRVSVRRAQRGTEAVEHASGAMVHWGDPVTLELPIATYRDNWNLGAER
jgi:hypothetical protein